MTQVKTWVLHLGSRYSVSERRWTQMLAGAEAGGPGPSPRSFHAAAYVSAGRGAMYLLGGLTAGGVTRDFWVLNLTTLQWRQEKVSPSPFLQPPQSISSRGDQSRSCRFTPRGCSSPPAPPLRAPAHVLKLKFTSHPRSRCIPNPVRGQADVILLSARRGHSLLCGAGTVSPTQPE